MKRRKRAINRGERGPGSSGKCTSCKVHTKKRWESEGDYCYYYFSSLGLLLCERALKFFPLLRVLALDGVDLLVHLVLQLC